MKRIRLAILGIAVSVCRLPCFAEGFVNVFEIPSSVSINVISNQLYHENINKTLHHWDNQPLEDRYKPFTKMQRAQTTGLGVSELTKNLPKEQAEAGRAAYQQALDYHEQVIGKFGLPSGDLAVAFASSIAVAGMLPASSQITWQRNPRAAGADELRARMRTQGGETLTRMLQVPPENVGIGPSGVYSLAAARR